MDRPLTADRRTIWLRALAFDQILAEPVSPPMTLFRPYTRGAVDHGAGGEVLRAGGRRRLLRQRLQGPDEAISSDVRAGGPASARERKGMSAWIVPAAGLSDERGYR